MSSQTQIIRTVFEWDTRGVEKGAATVEKAHERMGKAGRELNKKSGPRSENLTAGIRDLAEGRQINAMQRFGHAIGATSLRLGGYMLALKAAGAATGWIREELTKTDRAADRLQEGWGKLSRSATFSTAAEGSESLTSKIDGLQDQVKGETEQQSNLSTLKDVLAAARNGNPLSAAAAAAFESSRKFLGLPTVDEAVTQSEQRGRDADGKKQTLINLRSKSYDHELAATRMTGPGSNPYEAKRAELGIEKEIALTRAAQAGASEKDKDNIRARYDWLEKTVTAEENIAEARFFTESSRLGLEGSGKSPFQKTLALARLQSQASSSAIRSGNLSQPQERQEHLNSQGAQNTRNANIMGRYLNPDGSRRRRGDIIRDQINEARGDRRRGKFLEGINDDSYDKAGRRETEVHSPREKPTDFRRTFGPPKSYGTAADRGAAGPTPGPDLNYMRDRSSELRKRTETRSMEGDWSAYRKTLPGTANRGKGEASSSSSAGGDLAELSAEMKNISTLLSERLPSATGIA